MPEQMPESNFESPEVTKEQVIAAFKPFVDKGILHPDELDKLDQNDPEVQKADELFNSWCDQVEARSQEGDEEAKRFALLEIRTLLIEIGFTDPAYLDRIRHGIRLELFDDNYNLDLVGEALPDSFNKVREIFGKIDSIIAEKKEAKEANTDYDDLSQEQLLAQLEKDKDVSSLHEKAQNAVYKWFMSRLDEIKVSDNSTEMKKNFSIEINQIYKKAKYIQVLHVLQKKYLDDIKLSPGDKIVLKELQDKIGT